MSSAIVSITIGMAFLSSPSAFILIWLFYTRSGEAYLRSLAFHILGLFLMMAGNTVSFILYGVLHIEDGRISYLIMDEVFLATVMTSAYLVQFAHTATRTPITPPRKGLLWAFSILCFFLVQSLPIFLNGLNVVEVGHGYLVSTLYGFICHAYATVIIVRHRAKLPPFFVRFLPVYFLILLAIALVSVFNDLVHFGSTLLGGPDIPFSPFLVILVNVSIVYILAREMRKAHLKPKTAGAAPGLGLTGREKQVFPLLVDGLANDEIAEKLFISPHTVKNHVTSIFRKAGVANRFELLKRMTAPRS